jgi:hypothetical protein
MTFNKPFPLSQNVMTGCGQFIAGKYPTFVTSTRLSYQQRKKQQHGSYTHTKEQFAYSLFVFFVRHN